jgi:hypothetical protein
MTPFRRLGMVRSFTIFGHTFVSWGETEPVKQRQERAEPEKLSAMARSHEQ